MSPPNLFAFATSELSQDAFICWLISWADKRYEASHNALHKTAALLLGRFLEIAEIPKPAEYKSIEVRQQFKKLDVLVRLNDEICILIEDKTHTEEHSDQLKRYLDGIRMEFPNDAIAAIYFKTGDQSSYRAIKEAGFRPFRRQDLLTVLEAGTAAGVESDIFHDYHAHLSNIDKRVMEYLTLPLRDWHWDCWTGFFIALKERLEDGDWGYVANPQGGFMGFWWHQLESGYLQLEEEKLCFKIEIKDKAEQALGWDAWNAVVMAEAAQAHLKLRRPHRRMGTWMTVAALDGDYRRANAEGLLDLEETMKVLRQAESTLDAAVARHVARTQSD